MVSHKINIVAYGLHRDQPPVFALNYTYSVNIVVSRRRKRSGGGNSIRSHLNSGRRVVCPVGSILVVSDQNLIFKIILSMSSIISPCKFEIGVWFESEFQVWNSRDGSLISTAGRSWGVKVWSTHIGKIKIIQRFRSWSLSSDDFFGSSSSIGIGRENALGSIWPISGQKNLKLIINFNKIMSLMRIEHVQKYFKLLLLKFSDRNNNQMVLKNINPRNLFYD